MSAHSPDSHSDLDLVIDQLLHQARSDTRLAAVLRRQAMRVLDNLDEPQGQAEQSTPRGYRAPASSEDLGRLLAWSKDRQGRSASGMISISGEAPESDDEGRERYQELADVCHLKARAADWRACALSGGHAPLSEREVLIHEASDTGVFLWTVTRSQDGRLSREAPDYQILAEAYFACAEALEAWGQLPIDRAREILSLIAESQSMIRAAATRVGHRRREDTAEAVHGWLCEVAAEIQVYIPRFMKVGESADPDMAADLRARVGQLLNEAAVDLDEDLDDEFDDDDDDGDDDEVAQG